MSGRSWDGQALRLLVARPPAGFQGLLVAGDIGRALRRAGALIPDPEVESVDAIPRTAAGKAPLIRSVPPA